MKEHGTDIRTAIAQGRIRAFYQPIVRVATGERCGMEALARWDDPERGLLLPADFVSRLEDEGTVHVLDAHMLDLVCADIRARLDAGVPAVPVSVNFSRSEFSLDDMVADVVGTASAHGVPAELLVVEVTESALGQREQLARGIRRLREAGFSVWMDDFGTGYSSLASLCELDFDGLKLDMQFLMSGTKRGRAIVRHTVALAHDLGMKTIAEGVTRASDVDFLRGIGCDCAQGSYFGKPRPLS